MKVDIIEYCKFSANGIIVKHCQAGEKGVEIPDDTANTFIDNGVCKKSVEKKAVNKAPENKMLKEVPENKVAKAKPKDGGKSQTKKKKQKASK